jgi:putative endonuclease
MASTYDVYILASDSRELYVGVTNDIYRRVSEHRSGLDPDSYATKHRTFQLVYCGSTHEVLAAIRREKQIKSWGRRKRLTLIDAAIHVGETLQTGSSATGFGPLAPLGVTRGVTV